MRLSALALLAATAGSFALAGPAAAITGSGVSSALRSVMTGGTVGKDSKTHICKAGDSKRQTTPTKGVKVDAAHMFQVIACEMPPRVQISAPNLLNPATANAVATLG